MPPRPPNLRPRCPQDLQLGVKIAQNSPKTPHLAANMPSETPNLKRKCIPRPSISEPKRPQEPPEPHTTYSGLWYRVSSLSSRGRRQGARPLGYMLIRYRILYRAITENYKIQILRFQYLLRLRPDALPHYLQLLMVEWAAWLCGLPTQRAHWIR